MQDFVVVMDINCLWVLWPEVMPLLPLEAQRERENEQAKERKCTTIKQIDWNTKAKLRTKNVSINNDKYLE